MAFALVSCRDAVANKHFVWHFAEFGFMWPAGVAPIGERLRPGLRCISFSPNNDSPPLLGRVVVVDR